MKNLLTYFALIVLLSPIFAYSQTMINVNKLEEFSVTKSAEAAQQKLEAEAYAIQNNIPIQFETEDGKYFELQAIQDGIPQYYVTNNVNAAKTISTINVQPGGSSGLNLSGSGIVVHQWDAGAVRTTHQEYGGRVIQGDNPSSTHYHATHVAGTILATGVVANAKGMAPNATMRAFDWNYDESEMASEAANGALFSNHSYGYVRGWSWNGQEWVWYGNTSISSQEDYLFGFYDSQARDWDQISYNAPYYLIVKSAGNDRNDGPNTAPSNDGPYDCISHSGIAKNVITVGAVNDITSGYSQPSNVVMSSFSSWGPADDGRVKPDIVANGVGLYSTMDGNDAAYSSLSGTSMSSPNVTGSLALLQEHYHNLNGEYMRASTLKGLVIATADEAGNFDGPDYQFGWGLMNTEKAALKISEDQQLNVIDEVILNNGSTYTKSVYSDGTKPLRITICWTDPAGSPTTAQLDPLDPALVNDLDLRVSINGNTYYPWKLDPLNPTAAATNNSENNVDNLEMVYIPNPAIGFHTIEVDHDGILSGNLQAFSIIIEGNIDISIPPIADFSANRLAIFEGESVDFSDLSTAEPNNWSWSFEGATPATSTAQNPTVTYNTAGVYDVQLIVSNSSGADTLIKENYITVNVEPPLADFTSDITTVLIDDPVQFTDASTNSPASWSWSFEGATPATSTAQNPSVTYSIPGTYNVSLTVTNDGGSDTKTVVDYITVTDGTVTYCDSYSTDFSNEYISRVQIADLDNSSGGSAYSDFTSNILYATANTDYSLTLTPWKSNANRKQTWRVWIDYNIDGDFNDAGELVFSSDRKRNPVNGTFTTPSGLSGTTRMRVSMEYNSNSIDPCGILSTGEVEDYSISFSEPVPMPPVADLAASSTSVTVGNSISFSDLSLNDPTSWSWTFEGGTPSTSTSQNPTVTYNTVGTYNVSLTVTNPEGSDSKTIVDYITVSEAGNYCDSKSNSNALEWISGVQIGSFTNNSLASNYSDFTSNAFNLTAGTSVNVTLTPGYSGRDQREFWRIWIDFNSDGDFEDSDETILVLNNKKGSVTETINIPTYAYGQMRMRVTMKNGSPPSSCEIFEGGEVEDYSVNIVSANEITELTSEIKGLSLYPNPVENKLYLDIEGNSDNHKIIIFNNIGQIVFEATQKTNRISINTEKFSSGVYLIRISNGNQSFVKRFIKK